MKKVVKYTEILSPTVQIGEGVLLIPIDHPDEDNVSNLLPARTSRVVSYDSATGEIETQNTIYQKG